MKSKRIKIPQKVRDAVLKRDGIKCHYCGCKTRKGTHRHLDHKNGDNTDSLDPNNLVVACKKCNTHKSNKKYEDYLKYVLPILERHIKNIKYRLKSIK